MATVRAAQVTKAGGYLEIVEREIPNPSGTKFTLAESAITTLLARRATGPDCIFREWPVKADVRKE